MSSETAPSPPPSSAAGRIALAMVAVLCALFGGAFIYAYRQTAVAGNGMVITRGDDARPDASNADGGDRPAPGSAVVVHVAGAVRAPGVYTLPAGSRSVDALKAAGGPSPDADQDALNLAALIADGDQIVVPRRQRSEPSSVGDSTAASDPSRSPPKKLKDPGEGSVNINTASADELQRLPGIGPAMAARILTFRKEIGRFTSVEQLLDVSGIGEKKLAQMKPFVRIR